MAAGLAYILGLMAFYPALAIHFVRHDGEAANQAVLHAFIGHHSPLALSLGLLFFAVGFVGHRRILAAQAGRAVLLPTLVGALLGALVVSAGPAEALLVAFLATFLGFAGSLFVAPGPARLVATPAH